MPARATILRTGLLLALGAGLAAALALAGGGGAASPEVAVAPGADRGPAGPVAAARAEAPPRPAAAAAQEPADPLVRTDHKVPRPLHRPCGLPPGTRIPVGELPAVDEGIRLPDGRLLPFLNGMNWAPPVQRDRGHGPVPPVVAILVDAEGFQWYEHADGSVTTCMYQEVKRPHEHYWDPSTKHTVPVPRSRQRAVDGH